MPKLSYLAGFPVLLLAVAACSKQSDAPAEPPPPPPINVVLPNVPIPPGGVALTQESGADATMITFVTPVKPDSVVRHYRIRLAEGKFRLVSEETSKDGTTFFMAEQDNGPNVWITVKSDSAGGSAVTVAGGTTVPSATQKKGG